jgi:hypothetical protein
MCGALVKDFIFHCGSEGWKVLVHATCIHAYEIQLALG